MKILLRPACLLLLIPLQLVAVERNARTIEVEYLPEMPLAITNNAVALLPQQGGFSVYSFLGLEAGRTWKDASSLALHYEASGEAVKGAWKILEAVPGEHGRLASSAVVAGGEVYLFGGYTVARDGGEESTVEVFRLDRETARMKPHTTMPVPVEDSVLGVWRDRWIYMISGWHDVGNVNLVQVFDVALGEWTQATPYPGQPVFGHAGGIVGDTVVVCDGVRIEYQKEPEPRRFLPSDECWKGTINDRDHRRIDWRRIDPHPGEPMYRMAAGSDDKGHIWFAGGSDNPYNFNGIGYDGHPSEPCRDVFSYDTQTNQWSHHGVLSVGTMDHRGLLHHDGWFYVVGGMRKGQQVTSEFIRFRP